MSISASAQASSPATASTVAMIPPSIEVDVTPPAVLLMGPPGTGKTDSLATILSSGLELFVVGTEPRFIESLLDSCKRRGIPIDKLHWTTVEPMRASFASLISMAKTVNMMTYEGLTKIPSGPATAADSGQFIKLLESLNDFKCERTKQSFGPVDKWGPERCIVIDSLSGINVMARDLMLRGKPTAHQGEWGVSMDTEERLINKLCSDTKCMFVLIAHVDRETDEITGGTNVTVGALGKKLGPKIPRFFSEVILARREGDKHYWSTMTSGHDLKKRVLPYGDKLEPSFKPIIDAWRSRSTQAGGSNG